jgi:FkbM family methyltransferase
MKRTLRAYALDAKHKFIRAYRNRFGHRCLLVERLGGEQSYGARNLDNDLRSIIQRKNGFYVELGANDGLTQSNTAALEFFDGWSGVLIEPVPAQFAKLQFNRSSKRNVQFNVACVSFEFPRQVIKLAEANLMTVPLEGESDIEDPIRHAEVGRAIQKGYDSSTGAGVIEVPAVTLTEVLVGAKAPRIIDFLSLDVEGGELEVLKGIRFDLFTFRWMLIESRSHEKVMKFLEPHQYRLDAILANGNDLLFRNDVVNL